MTSSGTHTRADIWTDNARFTVYADFNCPFSYAVNERLFEMHLELQVDFRLIQHQPKIQSDQVNLEVLSGLTTEVAEVRRRAPSVEINIPMFRPSSAPAIALVYAVSLDDPVSAIQLRRRIYQALWVDGLDISDSAVLASLMIELELEMSKARDISNETLNRWQSEWSNNAEFGRNIPILISDIGETVIGSLLEPELDIFLEFGSLITDKVTSGLGDPPKRQRIIVLDNDSRSLRTLVEQMHDAQVEIVEDLIGLIAQARNMGMPDLLLINPQLAGDINDSDWWRNISRSNPDPAIPIIHILNDQSSEAQIAALDSGAVDTISRPFHPRLLRSRLNLHLQARRAKEQINAFVRVDALTSVCNRREFDARLNAEWARSARSENSLALLLINIDQLKAYNEIHGHASGDECLVKVSRILSSRMRRSGDWVARFSGGTFSVLLPGSDLESALSIANACWQDVAETRMPHSTAATYVTVKIGVAAMVPCHNMSCTLLIEKAEVALYQAKLDPKTPVSEYQDSLPIN
ncbi:MAG: diguanylate cyclase [Pseudomonadota bacterium]